MAKLRVVFKFKRIAEGDWQIEAHCPGEEIRYTIVGEHEADIKSGKIAVTAPVARALIGKEVGDTAQVRTPKGSREYEILEVKFVAVEDE